MINRQPNESHLPIRDFTSLRKRRGLYFVKGTVIPSSAWKEYTIFTKTPRKQNRDPHNITKSRKRKEKMQKIKRHAVLRPYILQEAFMERDSGKKRRRLRACPGKARRISPVSKCDIGILSKPICFLRKSLLLLPLIFLCRCEVSPSTGGRPETVTILSWNLQALFDGKETGNEYNEYRETAGWTDAKYSGRVTALAKAIKSIEPKPDILAFEEAETSDVLKDLAANISGLPYVFFANNPGASLGIGIISRFPFIKTLVHSIYDNGEVTPRPVLEVWIAPNDTAMVLFICHWKSKLGGADETESQRKASAMVIRRRIDAIAQSDPALPVAVMGDLNENHDEFYRQGASRVSALMPDDSGAASLVLSGRDGGKAQNDFLVLSGNKPPAPLYFPETTGVFFTPWEKELEKGSYYYGDSWETIDHVLLSRNFFDASGWDYESCRVIDEEPFVNRYGSPASYNPKTGAGLSDHLPLLLRVRMQP
jgi:endonuclease/exonuclease/phosphatase family metal-dependent hydrolase